MWQWNYNCVLEVGLSWPTKLGPKIREQDTQKIGRMPVRAGGCGSMTVVVGVWREGGGGL